MRDTRRCVYSSLCLRPSLCVHSSDRFTSGNMQMRSGILQQRRHHLKWTPYIRPPFSVLRWVSLADTSVHHAVLSVLRKSVLLAWRSHHRRWAWWSSHAWRRHHARWRHSHSWWHAHARRRHHAHWTWRRHHAAWRAGHAATSTVRLWLGLGGDYSINGQSETKTQVRKLVP